MFCNAGTKAMLSVNECGGSSFPFESNGVVSSRSRQLSLSGSPARTGYGTRNENSFAKKTGSELTEKQDAHIHRSSQRLRRQRIQFRTVSSCLRPRAPASTPSQTSAKGSCLFLDIHGVVVDSKTLYLLAHYAYGESCTTSTETPNAMWFFTVGRRTGASLLIHLCRIPLLAIRLLLEPWLCRIQACCRVNYRMPTRNVAAYLPRSP